MATQDAPSYPLYSNLFGRQAHQPKALLSQAFTHQKLAYIPNNPVAADMGESAAEYLYRSARDYDEGRSVGLLALLDERS